jgi:hypothetical protein
MPTKTDTPAVERSTYAVTASFKDEVGASVVPTLLQWSLLGEDRATYINGRQNVAVAVPAASVTIVLTGADLAIIKKGRRDETRYLVLEGTYTSTLGAGLSLTDELSFQVVDIAKVPAAVKTAAIPLFLAGI